MLSISKIDNNYFAAKFGYSNNYFERVRRVPGSEWNAEERFFEIPMGMYEFFKKDFKGEFVYGTNKYDFPNEPIEDYSKRYNLSNKYELPSLKLKPYDYQNYGFNFMMNKLDEKRFVMNCDSVGLGKSLQAISSIMYLIKNRNVKKVLILCKKSLKFQWKNEIEKFTYYNLDNVLIVDGTKSKKRKIYEQFNAMDEGILISNYDVVVSKDDMDLNYLLNSNVEALVIDEAHTLKGHTTIKNKKISKISDITKYKILLTGTPMASKPADLFGVMKLASKNYFGTKKSFDQKFLVKDIKIFGGRPQEVVDGVRNLDVLESQLHDIMISRSEREVELDSIRVCA